MYRRFFLPIITISLILPILLVYPEMPPKFYMGREIAQTMHYSGAEWLIRETRENEEAASRLIQQLNIQPGMTVCDLGCGNGYYTIPLAQKVGERGLVYAVDIQPEMLELLRLRAEPYDLKNIAYKVGSATEIYLPPNSINLVLLVDVYHEFSHPEEMLHSIRSSLKPNGRVALVEFRAEDPQVPIKPLHKMSKEQILTEWTANGFVLTDQYDELPWQHLMFFQRDDSDGKNSSSAKIGR